MDLINTKETIAQLMAQTAKLNDEVSKMRHESAWAAAIAMGAAIVAAITIAKLLT